MNLLFSERRELAVKVTQWLRENNGCLDAFGVITALQALGSPPAQNPNGETKMPVTNGIMDIHRIFERAMAFENGLSCGKHGAHRGNTDPANFTTIEKCQAYERGYAKGLAERYVPPTRDCPQSRYGHDWKWNKEKERSICSHCEQELSDEELAMCPSCDTCEIHPSQEDVCSTCRVNEGLDESYQWSFNPQNGVWE